MIGEAEDTWPAVLADTENGKLESIYKTNHPPSLKNIPLARRDLIHKRGLFESTVIATRGCPHRCNYCNLRQIYDPSLRFRPVEEVIAEVRTFRTSFFTFWDDQLFMSPSYALKLFKDLESQNKRWAAMVTLSSTEDDRLLRAASRAGCVCLFLGLESFSAESLALANKSFNLVETYAEGVARIHKYGIAVQAGIVFGFDGDDESTFDLTLAGATKAGIDGATISILTPFPRTPLFESLRQNGRLLTQDWSYYNGKTAVAFRPARMSPETLWNGYLKFRRTFYSPARMLQRMVKSWVHALQSLILNWGYYRTLSNRIPGSPIPAEASLADFGIRMAAPHHSRKWTHDMHRS
ncbi:MAG: radical SAM protein [bacterium]